MLREMKKQRLAVNIKQFEELTFEQVKAYLEANKQSDEVQAYFNTNVLTADNVKKFLETNEGRKVLQPKLDAHFSKSLETWKANNLEALIEEEIQKRNPTETPEQKRIRELEEKLQKQEREAKLAKLKEKALQHATEKGLPTKFATKYIDRFLGDDEIITASTLDELKQDLDSIIEESVNARFKDYGRQIDHGTGGSGAGAVDISALADEVSLRK
ncbi:DUF4355 domain-containing protein [Ureibacillus suwonensis]|uniref:DUF4355 domain-containing protein n=1 Tax=Ureibacillus suwonensis TaxID=313007 RepID=A0ABW0RDL6_9BACL